MIEDKELRDLFRMECEEHLQCLDHGLLSLEQRPVEQELLEDVFRAAHSIKGAARMLGLNQIQALAHVLEDALGALKNGDAPADKNLNADLYQKLAEVRQLVAAAVGVPIGIEDSEHLPEPDAAQQRVAEPVNRRQSDGLDTSSTAFRIGTLRVDPQRLDALLTHAGELAVTTAHIASRLQDIDTLAESCEEWARSLKLSSSAVQDPSMTLKALNRLQTQLSPLRSGFHEDSHRLDFISEQISSGIRTLRLLPFSTLFNQFPRLVHELAQTLHKDVELILEGSDVVVDKRILEELKDPIMHLLRNAVAHGLEDAAQRDQSGKPRCGKIVLSARQGANHIEVEVKDDGCGLDLAKIKQAALKQGLYHEAQLALMTDPQIQALILAPGFTTAAMITEISGRGVGLDVVRTNVERLKGHVCVDSTPGLDLSFRLQLPLTLASMRVQLVGVQERSYALPQEVIEFSRRIKVDDLYTQEGRQVISLDNQPVAVVYLGELLELDNARPIAAEHLYCTFLNVEQELFGLIVDELLDETEVMLKAQSQLLKRLRNVSATTILVSGEVCPVLNPADLLKSLRKQCLSVGTVAIQPETTDNKRKKTLLLAEDSITTRTQEKRILESAGYEVVTAVDGLDAYNKFQTGQFDAVVSDVEMPNMSGFVLTEAIRKDKRHADLPIILVTSLSSEADQRRGLEVGANAYLVKSAFDQQVLLDCLERLV